MDLLQLQYFRVVASLEHMTKASELLHVSQPSLSRTISNLEEDLGTELFYRTGRKIKLNPYGKVFLQHVNRALDELKAGQAEIDEMKRSERPIVVSCGVAGVFTDLAEGFQKIDGSRSVIFRQDPIENIRNLIDTEAVDFVISDIVLADFDTSDWRTVSEENMYALVSEDHPLANNSSITFKQLEKYPLVLPESSAPIRRVLSHFFRLCQAELFPVYEVNDVYAQLHLVESGTAISILPSSALYDIISKHAVVGFRAIDRVKIIPISDTNVAWTIAISPLTSRISHSSREPFYRFCLDYFGKRRQSMSEVLPPVPDN